MDLSTREGRRQLGERIKQAARDNGLTLDELGRRIDCSRALIYQYASGASLAQLDRLQQIAREVNRPLHWFFLEGAELEENKAPEASSISRDALLQEQALLQEERERLAAERSRFERNRVQEDIGQLEALLDAHAAPINLRRVVDTCQQLLPLLAHDTTPERLAAILLQQGNALVQLQEWGAAKEKLDRAAALFRQAGNHIQARDCVQSMGHANLMLGRVEEALQQFEYVASGEDWANRWQGTLSAGAVHEVMGNYPAAMSFFERALEIVEERGESPDTEVPRLFIEANWSNLELDFGDYPSALERSQRCMRMAQRLGVQDQYIEALLTHGIALLNLGDSNAARGTVQQALDVSQLVRDQQHHSLALSCLSLCNGARHQPMQAITEGKEALAMALRCGAVRAEILAQRALSEAYLRVDNPSEAIYHASQGLAVANTMRVRLAQAQFGALIARSHLAAGNLSEASSAAERSLRLAIELQARPAQLESHLALARAALGNREFDRALAHAEDALNFAPSFPISFPVWSYWSVIAQAHAGLGHAAEAHTAFQQAISGLAEARRQEKEATEEDTMLEEPLAMDLWQQWLKSLIATQAEEEARSQAVDVEWPPLLDWLETHLIAKGGKSDA